MTTGGFNLFAPANRQGGIGGGGGGPGGGGPPRPTLDKLFDRPPPHSPEAEMALLGAMILDPRVIHEVISIIKAADMFFMEAHAAIFAALIKTYDQKQAGDLVLVHELLRDNEQLKDVGGKNYLARLAEETPGPASAIHFAKIVADKARLRKLITAAGQIVFDAYNSGLSDGQDGAKPVVDRAESLIFEIAQQEETSDAQPLNVLLEQEYKRLEAMQGVGVSGIATGYTDLDELTTGFQRGDLIIVAARPSMGKTALSLNLAEQIARGGLTPDKPMGKPCPVGYFSLEMSKSAIAQRLLSAASGFSSHQLRSGQLRVEDYDHLCKVMYELSEAPIFVDDTPSMTVLQLRTRARRLVSQFGVQCIMIDYLQLMTAPQVARESRQVEVAAISRGIKALARELNVPVVCLAQLNRGPESRGDNRPRMSDLRESGSIEQDADVVMLLHRESYYHVGDKDWEIENEDKLNLTELIIAKQRNGPTDVVKLTWDSSVTRFRNFASYPGGTGLSPGYASRPAAPAQFPHAAPADPFKVEVVPFSPGKKTGPLSHHRDGGGPDREEPPFDDSGDVGLPL